MKLRLYILHTDVTESDFENFNEIQKEDILLSADEITGYNFSMKGDVPRGQLIIKGNMINGLTEEDSLKADFAKLMERLLSNSLELDNVWKKIPSNYVEQVKNMIKTKYTNIDTSTTVVNDNITYLNQENLQKLKYWNQEFYNSVYRTVILEIIYGDCTRLIVLEKAFIHSYRENISKYTSNGEFELIINQKKWENKKILNYISDKEVLGVPVDIFEGATPQTFKGELKGTNFSLNGLETPLVAGAGLVGTGLATAPKEEEKNPEKIDVCLFDVNDAHVQFLLGKSPATMVYKSTITQDTHKELYSFLNSKETLFVGYKRNLQPLFNGTKRELTRTELEKVETLDFSKSLTAEEIASFPLNSNGYMLWGNTINNALSSVVADNFLNTVKLNISSKLKGSNSILEEDYFIYKIEKENGEHLLIGMSKDIHYGRNKYQEGKIPTHKNQLQLVKNNQFAKELFESKFPKKTLDNIYYFEKTKIFYKRLGIMQSLYHGTENEKFVNISTNANMDGLFEVVFDSKENIVLTDEALGTFNFYGPNKTNAHTLYDVIPYWLWGNTKNDKSQLSDRFVAVENLLSLLGPLTPKSIKVKTIVLTRFIKNLF